MTTHEGKGDDGSQMGYPMRRACTVYSGGKHRYRNPKSAPDHPCLVRGSRCGLRRASMCACGTSYVTELIRR